MSKRKLRRDLERHFESVRNTAHLLVEGHRSGDLLNLPMEERWKGFYENTRRLGRDYEAMNP